MQISFIFVHDIFHICRYTDRCTVGVQLRLGGMADDSGDTLARLSDFEQMQLLECAAVVATSLNASAASE